MSYKNFILGLLLIFGLAPAIQGDTNLFNPGPGLDAEKAFEISAWSEYVSEQAVLIKVRFKIAPGFSLYASKTNLTVMSPGFKSGEVRRSPAKEKNDPFLGKILIYTKEAELSLPVTLKPSLSPGRHIINLKVAYQGCSSTGCFMPTHKTIPVTITLSRDASTQEDLLTRMDTRFGFAGILLVAFLWGILASLTPCVYPMLPISISIIGAGNINGSTWRSFGLACVYVLGLSLTYALFGVLAAFSGSLFGSYANLPIVRIILASIFILLGLSMFDLLSIQMPAFIINRLSSTSASGAGLVGVFLGGVISGVIVGPCVGPLLSAVLLYIATIGSMVQGFLIMWSFALGLGILFLVAGTFSGAMASMPKAGLWMEKIKQFLGLFLIGFSLYYLKPLLNDFFFEILLGLFLITFSTFSGLFEPLTRESSVGQRFSKAWGLLFLIVGCTYVVLAVSNDHQTTLTPKSSINWLTDESTALTTARQLQKPMIIDFSAQWCTACLRLEKETFSNQEVSKVMQNFVCLKIDNTDPDEPVAKQMRTKYNVVGLPTILFLNSKGEIFPDSVKGFVGPKVFLNILTKDKL